MFEHCLSCHKVIMPWEKKEPVEGEDYIFTHENPDGQYIDATESYSLCKECAEFHQERHQIWARDSFANLETQKKLMADYKDLKDTIVEKLSRLKLSAHAKSAAFEYRFECQKCDKIAEYSCQRKYCHASLCLDCAEKMRKTYIDRVRKLKVEIVKCPSCNSNDWDVNRNLRKVLTKKEKRFLKDFIGFHLSENPKDYRE